MSGACPLFTVQGVSVGSDGSSWMNGTAMNHPICTSTEYCLANLSNGTLISCSNSRKHTLEASFVYKSPTQPAYPNIHLKVSTSWLPAAPQHLLLGSCSPRRRC